MSGSLEAETTGPHSMFAKARNRQVPVSAPPAGRCSVSRSQREPKATSAVTSCGNALEEVTGLCLRTGGQRDVRHDGDRCAVVLLLGAPGTTRRQRGHSVASAVATLGSPAPPFGTPASLSTTDDLVQVKATRHPLCHKLAVSNNGK